MYIHIYKYAYKYVLSKYVGKSALGQLDQFPPYWAPCLRVLCTSVIYSSFVISLKQTLSMNLKALPKYAQLALTAPKASSMSFVLGELTSSEELCTYIVLLYIYAHTFMRIHVCTYRPTCMMCI